MKRNMDLVRDLLLKVETFDHEDSTTCVSVYDDSLKIEGYSPEEINYHLELIIEAGLLNVPSGCHRVDDAWIVGRISWEGHEFIDRVRDPAVWKKTKEATAKAGGWTFKLLGEIASAYIQSQAKAYLNL